MSNQIVGVELQVNSGGSLETVKSFRTQIREAQQELIKVQGAFGDISPEAQKAAKAVAELRDRLKDSNEVAALFDPEKKFQAVVGVAQGIASGFAAAQGTMALFGVESKEVEATLLKVQAAMALSQGLSGVVASVEDFKRLGAVLGQIGIIQKSNAAANAVAAATMRLFGVATTQTGAAFNILKGAIIATGIGALIVAIGFLVNKVSELTSGTNEAAEAQRKLNEEMAETANKRAAEIAAIYDEDTRLQAGRLKAHGATEAEINKVTRENNEKAIRELRVNYLQQLGAGQDAAEAKKALDKRETDNQIFELGLQQKAREEVEKKEEESSNKSKAAQDKAKAARLATAQKAKEVEKEVADELFAIRHNAEETEINALNEKFRLRKEAYEKDGRDIGELLIAQAAEQGAIQRKHIDERAAEQAKKDADAQEANNKLIDSTIAAQDAQTQLEAEHAEARKNLAEKERDVKVNAAQAVSNALGGYAALAGEQTAAGKALAVTAATIQAILGAQQAFTALSSIPIVGPALGAIAAGGAIALGIANVKKILAVQVPGKGATSAGAGSLGSLNASAPLSPQSASAQPVQLNQKSINDLGNATVKAVVVESDITTSQQRINRIQSAATFR